MTTPALAPVAVPAHPTALDLWAVPDEVLLASNKFAKDCPGTGLGPIEGGRLVRLVA